MDNVFELGVEVILRGVVGVKRGIVDGDNADVTDIPLKAYAGETGRDRFLSE